ncbi:unnamed protein product [Paramecium sonneborni]|uniref:Uncharacterized protein n=1 Tax=Paramecium sonneborni TaxID=65129 RepID=A0A8S1KCH2_9CILI|nr:unnamed protein product [Paramecium sonneborni]
MQSYSQNEDINNFMSITGCQDYQKAQSFMQMAENILENAIQLYMDYEGGLNQNTQQNELYNQQQQQRLIIQESPKSKIYSVFLKDTFIILIKIFNYSHRMMLSLKNIESIQKKKEQNRMVFLKKLQNMVQNLSPIISKIHLITAMTFYNIFNNKRFKQKQLFKVEISKKIDKSK